MSAVTQKSSFGAAQIILFFSIAVLVILVAFPVLLILFNAFWVNGEFNIRMSQESFWNRKHIRR